MNLYSRILVCLVFCALNMSGELLFPAEALCRLSAEAELNYINYEVNNDFNRHLSANSLAQRYSLLYDTSGRILEGRLGWYDVALGYEWATFDTAIKSVDGNEDYGQSKGRILYKGEISLDPKELPLKLRMYSNDLNRASLITDTSSLLNAFANDSEPRLPTSLSNGQSIVSGATLVFGVKNGMTNGYNEVLRHFPMLLLDYQDQVNKDISSDYPVNNRLSRLAFVSLNKKDNWFHYRHITYKDYIDSNNNYLETQLQLGTVDETLQRRWIDFTNWLEVSTDGQLTRRVQLKNDTTEEFSFNLFATARRDTWEARAFNNFQRIKENNTTLTYKTSIPVYASGVLGPSAIWSSYAAYNENKSNYGSYFKAIAGGYKIDAFTKSSFTLNQSLGLEQTTASGGTDTTMVSGSIGTNSTTRFSSLLSLGANYTIRNYQYSKSDNDSMFTDQEITGNIRYNLSNELLLSFTQMNRFTSGRSQSIDGIGVSTSQPVDPRTGSLSTGSGYQSVSSLNVSWNPKPRFNISLVASEDIYVPDGGKSSTVTRIENSISYNSAKLSLRSRNTYSTGYSYTNSYGNVASQISSDNMASYIFNRSFDTRLRVEYYKSLNGDGDGAAELRIEQALNYYYYKSSGLTRRLFEVNEAFESNGDAKTGTINRRNQFSIGARYYPLRQMLIAAGSRYAFTSRLDNYTLSYYGSIGVQFRLLEASLDYSYGKSNTDGRIEKRFSANVKKKF